MLHWPLAGHTVKRGEIDVRGMYVGETGGNCNIFHINAHYVEHVFY